MLQNKKLLSFIGNDINSYTITRYINSGSFGDVFEAVDKKTNKLVAMKIPIETEEKHGQRLLLEEAKIYKVLLNRQDLSKSENTHIDYIVGIANIKIITSKKLEKKIMVMDLLGPSLESFLSKKKHFSLQTIILLSIEMIKIVKYIHSCGYIHRDLKPDNFVLDVKHKNKLYCIDFGLAKKYINNRNNHIEFNENNKFCGTARYASIGAHLGRVQSRRDDLESIGYILVYLYYGKLPWQNIKHPDKQKRYQMIQKKKQEISENDLVKDMTREFLVYFKYVKSLDFDEKPHYSSLINMFKKLYISQQYVQDEYDWNKQNDVNEKDV